VSVENLAAEFVAQPRWRWAAGMRGLNSTGDGFRIIAVDDERMFYIFDDDYTHPTKAHERTLAQVKADGWLPDMADAPTLGAIIDLAEPSPMPDDFITELLEALKGQS
jgi:hypothetical protein